MPGENEQGPVDNAQPAPTFYEYIPEEGEEDISKSEFRATIATGGGGSAGGVDDANSHAGGQGKEESCAPSHFAEAAAFLAAVADVAEECDAFSAELSAIADAADSGGEAETIAASLASFAAKEVATDHDDPGKGGAAERAATKILDLYQEQASLLDTDLERMITAVLGPVQRAVDAFDRATHPAVSAASSKPPSSATSSTPSSSIALLSIDRPLRLLYHLCKVRGAKTVRRFLPHEARDLEPIVALAQTVDRIAEGASRWQTRYCLLLWLSIVVMVPFDLETIDSGGAAGGGIIGSIVDLCESHLGDAGRTREAAAELVARLTTRPDMRAEHLVRFTEWCVNVLETGSGGNGDGKVNEGQGIGGGGGGGELAAALLRTGVFAALASVFEYGHRDELLPLMPRLFPALCAQAGQDTADIKLRKLHVKVTQRMGLIFLAPRVAPWRYQRGSRSLVGNLQASASHAAAAAKNAPTSSSATTDGDDDTAAAATGKPLADMPPLERLPSMGNTTAPFGVDDDIVSKITMLDGFGGAAGAKKKSKDAAPSASASATSPTAVDIHDGHDDGGDVPEETEDIIQRLLEGLADRDTVVRWSAAKGIGRITNRLPLALADDVVLAVIALLDELEPDAAWHGACLALAELARRGLLLPERLGDTVPRVCDALHYDVRRGAHSVGAHVRDAACYVAWSFARAYAPEVMQPFVSTLSRSLVLASLLDREVNVRRAASAAFQEHVGRQGVFAHGIEILTAADYFTVGSRKRSFTSVSRYVAGFKEYTRCIVDSLAGVKCIHWDEQVRRLAAEGLCAIAPVDPDYAFEAAMRLIPTCYSSDVPERHGAALGIAGIVRGLSAAGLWEIGSDLSLKGSAPLRAIVPTVEKKRLYRGRGGEVMREAAACLVEHLVAARIAMPRRTALLHMSSAEESAKHPTESISHAAVRALAAIAVAVSRGWPAPSTGGDAGDNAAKVTTTVTDGGGSQQPQQPQQPHQQLDESMAMLPSDIDELVMRLAKSIATDPNPGARRGYALALGAMPRDALVGSNFPQDRSQLETVVGTLIEATRIEENADLRDAESRRNAVRALADIAVTVTPAGFDGAQHGMSQILGALVCAAGDYTIDNRGDIGSWVREEAVIALHKVLVLCDAPEYSGAGLTDSDVGSAVDAIVALTVDKIDRLRDCALTNFYALLHGSRRPAGAAGGGSSSGNGPADHGPVGRIPARDQLVDVFPPGLEIDWSAPSSTFALTVPLLTVGPYRRRLLASLVCSVGGLTESLVVHSRRALGEHLRDPRRASAFSGLMLTVWRDHANDDRVVLPLLKTIDHLLTESLLDLDANATDDCGNDAIDQEAQGTAAEAEPSTVGMQVHTLLKAELAGCKSVPKLYAAVPILGYLLGSAHPRAVDAATRSMLLLLGHRYPVVRRHAADQWYTRIVLSGGGDDDLSMHLLSTPWDGDEAEARAGRDAICDSLGLPKPKRSAKARVRKEATEFNYKDLVEEMGY